MGCHNFTVITSICILVLAAFAIPQAFAGQSQITITTPQFDQTIHSSDVFFSGTYQDVPNSEPAGTEITNEVELSFDNGQYAEVDFSNGHWSYDTTLSDGWHTITALVSDNTGNHASASVQFLVLTQHFTPTRLGTILIMETPVCQRMLDHNITSLCPPLNVLAPFDTTNQTYAGKIIKNTKGEWVRTAPQVSQWWNFFAVTKKNIVCVECDFDFAHSDEVPIIWIDPHGYDYAALSPIQSSLVNYTEGNSTIQVQEPNSQITTTLIHHNVYVSGDCLTAEEPFNNTMLAETIYYIDSGCKTLPASLNQTTTFIPKTPPFDFNNPYSILHNQEYLKNILNGHYNLLNDSSGGIGPGNCINKKCNYKDPYSNW